MAIHTPLTRSSLVRTLIFGALLTPALAQADYHCAVALYDREPITSESKPLATLGLLQKTPGSGFGSVGTDVFYRDTEQSYLGFVYETYSTPEKSYAKINLYRKSGPNENRVMTHIQKLTRAAVEGDQSLVQTVGDYQLSLSCKIVRN